MIANPAWAGFLNQNLNDKNDGILVQTTAEPKAVQSGQSAVFHGTLKTLDDQSATPKPFTKKISNSIEIRTYFPDFTSERTTETQFSSKRDSYQFTTGPIVSSMNNEFITTVGAGDPECRSMLSLQSKLRRRINALDLAFTHLQHHGFGHQNFIPWLNLRSLLTLLAERIDSHLAQKYQDLTETHYALQFEGQQSAPSSTVVLGNNFRLKIEADPGNVFQDSPVNLNAFVKYMGDTHGHRNDRYDVEYRWNGVLVGSKENVSLNDSTELNFQYSVNQYHATGSFEIRIYEKKQVLLWKKRDLVAFLPFSPVLQEDSVAPIITVTDATPNSNAAYVQNPGQVHIEVTDPLGRIDPSTVTATLSGSQTIDLSAQLTSSTSDNGAHYLFEGAIPPLSEGAYQFQFGIKDFAGNSAIPYTASFQIDRTAPSIQLGSTDGILTRQPQFSLPITVLDASPVNTTVSLNGSQVKASTDLSFNADMTLSEGVNTVEISSIDAAGNTSEISLSNVILDSTPPVLNGLSPEANSTLTETTVPISGHSNEALSYAKVNDQPLTLSDDHLSFSGNYVSMATGAVTLHFEVADLVGNVSSRDISVEIFTAPLNGNLISVVPNSDGVHFDIIGVPGAAQPGITVDASAGFFNGASTTSNNDGSFKLSLYTFQNATVTASANGQTSSVTVNWGSGGTLLSGTVKDIDGNPLPGATISIIGSVVSPVLTDANGVFAFTQPVTGDQKVLVDGTSIQIPNKKFSKTTLSVSIGLSQSNVIQRPIYLVPIPQDGSATVIESASGGTVTNAAAPGASLTIPAGATQFPDGSSQGQISMATIPADVATIPPMDFAKPDQVVALEPSGTTFSEPVTLSLPNDNHLPAGTQMVVMSMNSITGKWELDGVGKVDPDETSVTTTPDHGITHFSLVFFAPVIAGPVEVAGNGNSSGATLSQNVNLPSYKVMGKSYTPQLLYNSIWAKPSAFVSNLFDLSPLNLTTTTTDTGSKQYHVEHCFLFFFCSEDTIDVYYQSSTKATSWYQPNLITAQFSVGTIQSPVLSFKGNPLLPARSIVSYKVDLNSNNQYLPSGTYQYHAKYQMHLDHLVVGTQTVTQWQSNLSGPQISTQSFSSDEQISEVFPKDLEGNILVDNEVDSSAGRGWKIAGIQKIINPNTNRILLEDGNGQFSQFVLNNEIQSLENHCPACLTSNNVTDLSKWPSFVGVSILGIIPQNAKIVKGDLSNQSLETIGSVNLPFGPTAWQYFGGIAAGSDGTTYFTVPSKNIIQQLNEAGAIETIAGNMSAGFNGDDHAPLDTQLNAPNAIMAGPQPNTLIFADFGNNRVRKLDLTTGSISTIAGNGQYFGVDTGDGGPATQASVSHPQALTYDAQGNLYIATENGMIRKVDTIGTISTFAGGPTRILADYVPANEVLLNSPKGLVVDNQNGYLYVSDTGNKRIVRIDFLTHHAIVIAGGATNGVFQSIGAPTSIGLDDRQNVIFYDSGTIRRLVFANESTGTLSFTQINTATKGARQNEDGTWVPDLQRNPDGTFTRNYRNGSVIHFDNIGREIASVDRLGNQTSYTYDENGNLTSMTDPSGGVLTYSYSGGELSSITDPAGRTTQLLHQPDGTLTQVKYPDGSTRHYSYNSDGLMLSKLDPNSHTTSYHYNIYDRLTGMTLPNDSPIQITDSASATAINNATNGNIGTGYEYGLNINEASDSLMDANGNQTTFAKDYRGYIETVKDSLGNITEITNDQYGRPITIAEPNQSTLSFTYNPWGDVISKTESISGLSTSQTFDNYGHQLSSTNGNGLTSYYTYDSTSGLLLSKTNPMNHSTTYTYNAAGLVTSITNFLGQTTQYGYDSAGNLITSTDPAAHVTTRTYDAAGNVLSITDANGHTTQYTYDAFNRLTSVTTSKNETTTYTYMPGGQLASVTDPKGGITSYQYDIMGNMIQKTDPLGNTLTRQYDNNGNVISETDPNGNVKSYQYDAVNNLVQTQLPDNTISMTYDFQKNPLSISDLNSQILFQYDSLGRLIQSSSQGLNAMIDLPITNLNYTWDGDGNRLSMSALNGTTSYTYDAADRLTAIQNPLNELYTYTYHDSTGNLTQTRPGSSTEYTFDVNRLIASITHESSSSTFASYQLTRDLVGNVTQMVLQNSLGNVNRTVAYDADNQVTSSSNPETSVTAMQNESFGYDSIFNRTSDQSGTYQYDSKSQRLTDDYRYHYYYDHNGNLIEKVSNTNLSDFTSYSYSSTNQLIRVHVFEPTSLLPVKDIHYYYDTLGRRIQKTVTNLTNQQTSIRKYAYDGSELLFEYDGSNQLLAQYTNSTLTTDDVLAVNITSAGVDAKMAKNAGSYTYLKDALGSIIDIADTSGNKLQHYVYSAFGILLGIQDANAADITSNPVVNTSYAFAGRELDAETGYYYNRARYYDPSIGRFLQEDPNPGQQNIPITIINHYTYAANNPFAFSDPTGQSFLGDLFTGILIGIAAIFTGGLAGAFIGGLLGGGILGATAGAIAGAIVGGITGGIIGGTSSLLQGHSFGEGFLSGAISGALAGLLAGAYAGYGATQANALGQFKPEDGTQLANNTTYNGSSSWPSYMGAPDTGLSGGIINPVCLAGSTYASWGLRAAAAAVTSNPWGRLAAWFVGGDGFFTACNIGSQ